MGDQALIQLAAEQGDAVGAGVVAEEMAGHVGLPEKWKIASAAVDLSC